MKRSHSIIGVVLVLAIGYSQGAMAQISADGTVGTIVNAVGNIFTIGDGARSGNNLFHSFSQFSVPTNGSAIFNNATDVQNIFSRVTGSQLSNIDGILKTQGGANLFLMNPNGIIFGPNAQLDLGGSFIGTTASSIKFSDAIEFNTVNAMPALLSMNVPIGLQMGQNPGAITAQGIGGQFLSPAFFLPSVQTGPVGLQVNGSTLALIGGNVDLVSANLAAPGGRVELGGVGREAVVGLTPTPQGYQVNYQDTRALSDVRLLGRSFVTASGVVPGSVQVEGRQISLQDDSLILVENQGAPLPSRIDIAARESLTITDSAIRGQSLGLGASADIQVSSPNLTLTNGGVISSSTFSPFAAGGTVQVQTNNLLISGFSPTNPQNSSLIATASVGGGNAGNLTLSTQQLSIFQGGGISSTTLFGNGDAGDVMVNADAILVSGISPGFGPSNIGSVTFSQGTSGSVVVNTRTLAVRESGSVTASSLGVGSAGSVTVNASESVQISGRLPGALSSNISSSVAPANPLIRSLFQLPEIPTGNAKDVTINTSRLEIEDIAEGLQANASVVNLGTGDGGRLNVNADSIRLNGGVLVALTLSGNGGDIAVNADLVQLRNSGKISTTAGGAGNGGNINLNASFILGLEDSDIIANAFKGRGGSIQITTEGIFGLKFRKQLTPDNDITASSELGVNGIVQVNNLGVDPNSGLISLPVDIIEPSQQIAKGCNANQGSSLSVTGRGGIPNHSIIPRTWQDRRGIKTATNRQTVLGERSRNSPKIVYPPIEATNWQRNTNSSIDLFAGNPSSMMQATRVNCADVDKS